MEEYMWNYDVLSPATKEVIRSLQWRRVGTCDGYCLMGGEAEIGHLTEEEVTHMVGYLSTQYGEQVPGGAQWWNKYTTNIEASATTIRVVTTLVASWRWRS